MKLQKLALFALSLSFVACSSNTDAQNKGQQELKIQNLPEKGIIATNGDTDIAPLYPLRLMKQNLTFLAAKYYDVKRIDWQKMTVYAIDALQNNIPELVAKFDKRIDESPTSVNLRVNTHSKTFDLGNVSGLLSAHRLCADVFNYTMQYVKEEQDPANLEYDMLNGMFSTLDPHTNLIPPRIFDDLMTMNGGFAGLGFVVGIRNDKLVIISPIEGAPAWRVGLKTGDHILQIDDESTENMPLEDAVDKMRGKAGTSVKLLISRKDWKEPKSFTIVREDIKTQSVTSKALKPDNIGYLKIKSFDSNTAESTSKMLYNLQKEMPDMKGLIVDLRNNTGGLLIQAIEMADLFLQKNQTIVAVEGINGSQREESKAMRTPLATDYPIVVLINSNSASASEILAGALQYHQRAIIVGEQSFGKGSVQVMKENSDKSAVKVTTAQYLTPGDVSIQGVGIVPDIQLSPVFVDKDGVFLFPTDKVQREATLERSLHNDKTKERTSFRVLHYLYKNNEEEQKNAKELGILAYDLRSTGDYTEDDETRFAIGLLKQAKSSKREEVLNSSVAYFDNYEKKHVKDLTGALQPLGINWKAPAPKARECDQFEWGLRLNEQKLASGEPLRVKAGETTKVGVWVKNNCKKEDLTQFAAVTKANNGSFDEREFIFGRIPPNKEKFWDVEVKIPKNAENRDDNITLRFYSAGTELEKAATFSASTEEISKPVFSYTYDFDDKDGGNGDGLIQQGESIVMNVHVTNTSDVDAAQVSVSLKNDSGKAILLTQGRDTKSELKSKQTADFKLKFDVRDLKGEPARNQQGKALPKDTLALTLGLNGIEYGVKLSEKLSLPIAPGKANTPNSDPKQPIDQPAIQFKSTTHTTSQSEMDIQATLSDNDALYDYQAYVWTLNNMKIQVEKLDYGVLSGNSKDISIHIPLKAGNNSLVIIARNKHKIENMGIYHILKTEEPTSAASQR